MWWIVLGLISALLLGLYDVLKKLSLRNNAVFPVLCLATSTSALIFGIILVLNRIGVPITENLYIPPSKPNEHFLFFIKSLIVGASWVFAFYALKNLPITIVTPIRATGPVWTLLGAIIIFSEKLNPMQWAGVITTIGFFYAFSLVGKKEGIVFRANKWIFFIVLATLIGAISSLFDKYLIQNYDKMAVQAWFSIYMAPVMWIVYFIHSKTKVSKVKEKFHFSWFIPLIGVVLSLADYAYFWALDHEGALISLLSAVRRSSVIYSFLLGAAIFKDKNIRQKWPVLAGILLGVLLIVFGS